MTIPYPSLSPAGWVTEIRDKLDRVYAAIFYTDFSQSNNYNGRITSIPAIIQQHGNNKIELEREMNDSIEAYLSRYFDLVTVSTRVELPEDKDDNRMQVFQQITVTQDGQKYDVSKVLRVANNKVVGIIDRA